ncbi:MAG: YitT family protein [Coprobacillaceae bacterium]
MDIKLRKNIITIGAVLISAIVTALVTKTFIRPAGLLSSGFMGIAIFIDMIVEQLGGSFPASIGLICLNIPVAIFCYKKISPRFVIVSLAQVLLTSLFLQILPTYTLFDEEILNVIFGGFIYGLGISVALRGNASTGGTDFIALYVSNKSGKEIWTQLFIGNTIMLCIFGYMFGFEHAGYSILFQFMTTKTIGNFHTRYKRIMLQIFTKEKDKVIDAYVESFRHGITSIDGIGGYSKKPVSMLTAIVASYEVDEVIEKLKEVDPEVIINATKSEKYVGRFYTAPIE